MTTTATKQEAEAKTTAERLLEALAVEKRTTEAKQGAEQRRLLTQYRLLLTRRHGREQKGDKEKLKRVMAALGKTEDDVKADIEIVKEHAALSEQLLTRPTVKKEFDEARAAHKKLEETAKAVAKQLEAAWWRFVNVGKLHNRKLPQAEKRVAQIRREYPHLFDDQNPSNKETDE